MAGGLTGLTGISGNLVQANPAWPAERVQGSPANPTHGVPGEQAAPYPWQMTQWGSESLAIFGTDIALVGQSPAALPAGNATQDPDLDRTPTGTHAAPWPKDPIGDGSVGPDNTARQLIQSAIIHGVNTGASAARNSARAYTPAESGWVEYASVDPGSSLQPTGVPQPIGTTAGGWGSTDRYNSDARQNEYGFDSAHLHRRVNTEPMPLNYLWQRGAGRPMVRSLPGAMRLPIGVDSPFAGQNPAAAYGTDGAILTATPPDYVPPPQPATAPAPGTTGAPAAGGTIFSPGWW